MSTRYPYIQIDVYQQRFQKHLPQKKSQYDFEVLLLKLFHDIARSNGKVSEKAINRLTVMIPMHVVDGIFTIFSFAPTIELSLQRLFQLRKIRLKKLFDRFGMMFSKEFILTLAESKDFIIRSTLIYEKEDSEEVPKIQQKQPKIQKKQKKRRRLPEFMTSPTSIRPINYSRKDATIIRLIRTSMDLGDMDQFQKAYQIWPHIFHAISAQIYEYAFDLNYWTILQWFEDEYGGIPVD